MVARLAISTTGRNGQYVGTTRVVPPTAGVGSPTARRFNGSSDRIICPRSNDLGPEFMLMLTFWRTDGSITPNDLVSERLFSQYALGSTRIGVGFNRSFLAVNYTDSNGSNFTAETRVEVLDTRRHHLMLLVRSNGFSVHLDGYEAFSLNVNLADPDSSRANLGSDCNSRFFKGVMDDVATYRTLPRFPVNWAQYYRALVTGAAPRDYTAATFAAGYDSVTLTNNGFSATGALLNPQPSRVPLAQAFRTEPELPMQFVEFRFLPLSSPGTIKLGVFNPSHDLSQDDIGTTLESYAYTQDGRLLRNNVPVVSSLGGWGTGDSMALGWESATGKISLWRNGTKQHEYALPADTWTAAVTLGPNSVSMNSGQLYPFALPLDSPGLPSVVYSRLNTEFRQMKLAELCSPLDEDGDLIRDAYTGVAAGSYLGSRQVVPGFTPDSLDKARQVGGGVKVNFAAHTTADDSFFFAIAYQPHADDLIGEKVILESPGKWGIRLLDGKLNAWVGSVQTGSSEVAFDPGSRYLIGLSRSPGGKLLVWCHIGYILQSGDVTPILTAGDVWVGSGADGARALTGKFSHLVLSSQVPARWKLDRLRQCYDWDLPNIAESIPNPPTVRLVFEPSWRDVIHLGVSANPSGLACYAAAVAIEPDAMAIEYRMVARKAPAPFTGAAIKPWAAHGKLQSLLSRFGTTLQLVDFNDLSGVTVGSVALIDNEIVRVDTINHATGEVTIARACVDTVPAPHGAATTVWFYESTLAFTPEVYVINDLVEVKLLSRSSLVELEESMSPSDEIVMTGRLNRPFPPADVTINDLYEPVDLFGTLQVKWKHRNKSVQGASVLDWYAESVAASPSMTYRVRAYDPATGLVLHESSELASTVTSYDLYVEFTGQMAVAVVSYQNNLPCWQEPQIGFQYTNEYSSLILSEDGDAIETEDFQDALGLEMLSGLRAGSHSGDLPDDYNPWDGEEEEEEEVGGMAGSGHVVGIPISEFGEFATSLSGTEHLPLVANDTNYKVPLSQVLAFIAANTPEAVDGKNAYELWLEAGNTGTLTDFFEAYRGAAGPVTNQSRRILTVSSASGAMVCDWAQYDEIRLRLVGDITLTFQGAKDGQGCILKLQQDAVGGRTVTLPTIVRYNAFLAFGYTATPTPNLVDRVAFTYDSADGYYDFNALAPGYFTN